MSLGYIGANGEPVLVATLPLGIDLRAGVVAQADGREAMTLPLQQCIQDGCIASKALDGGTLTALKKTRTPRLGVWPYGAKQSLTMLISMKGVTAGLEALQ